MIEIVGVPEDLTGGELENRVIKTFEAAGVKTKKRDFHAIHRLANKKVVIAKLVNRRDAIEILRKKKKLRELSPTDKEDLGVGKIYINESLCPYNKRLLGKCNALFKKKKIDSFFTINGKIKIKYDGELKTEITHIQDLIDIFGAVIMEEIDAERRG